MPETVEMFTDKGTPVRVNIIYKDYEIATTEYGPQYVDVLDATGVRFLAECIKDKVREGFDCNILWTGKRRSGKTTAATWTGLEIDPSLKLDNITFRLEDFNELLAKNPYANPANDIWPQAILDEAGFDLYNLDFMKTYQKNLVKKLEVIGMKNQIVHYVLPHRKKLNKSIREEIIAYWVNVRGGFGQSRGFAEVREGVENIFEENMYWKPRFCFIYPELDNELWREYLKKKRLFVDQIAEDSPEDSPDGRDRILSARNAAIREYYQYRKTRKDPITHADLAKIVGLSDKAVSKIMTQRQRPKVASPTV